MARAKSVRVEYKGINVFYENNELLGKLQVEDEETGEILTSDLNLTAEVKDFLKTLDENDTVAFCMKKFKPMSAKESKPKYKYSCGCGKEIKSEYDSLHIHCNDCDEDFIMGD